MDKNIYIQLTKEFNEGCLRAIICSGQAVVLHRVAIMSKDGDWILREEEGALTHVLTVLERHGARYRFGAPLDVRWMAEGWSAHFEFRREKLRVRTDFFTRPPRIPANELPRLWREHAQQDIPFLNANDLAVMKKTNRERDYAVIGELARLMPRVEDQVLHSRSARDLIAIHEQNPELFERLRSQRPVLHHVSKGRERLEVELDAERRALIRANEARLDAYGKAAARWHSIWPEVSDEIAHLRLLEAHRVVVDRAKGILPTTVLVPRAHEGDRDAR
jgi:hypothetical protein